MKRMSGTWNGTRIRHQRTEFCPGARLKGPGAGGGGGYSLFEVKYKSGNYVQPSFAHTYPHSLPTFLVSSLDTSLYWPRLFAMCLQGTSKQLLKRNICDNSIVLKICDFDSSNQGILMIWQRAFFIRFASGPYLGSMG